MTHNGHKGSNITYVIERKQKVDEAVNGGLFPGVLSLYNQVPIRIVNGAGDGVDDTTGSGHERKDN